MPWNSVKLEILYCGRFCLRNTLSTNQLCFPVAASVRGGIFYVLDAHASPLPEKPLARQQNHCQRQAFRDGNGKPHALRSDNHRHQDEGRHKEHQAAKQHKQRRTDVLADGLVVADDSDI